MKKILLTLTIFALLLSNNVFAASVKYEVPVDVMHYSRQPGKKSMATNAIKHVAIVEEKDGVYTYRLHFQPMEFMNLTGQLTNLFIYNDVEKNDRVEATRTDIKDGNYNREHTFVRNNPKENEIIIAVWVDAMDGLAGGEKGAGEQKAILTFEWDKAKVISGGEVKKEEKKEVKETPKGEIKIQVNGKLITPETPAFINNNRTMVPVRFISEALGLKVGWNATDRVVTVGEGSELAELKIGSNVVKKGGGEIKIDSPAMIKDSRTFVPLRAIAEVAGGTVDWNGETRTVIINK